MAQPLETVVNTGPFCSPCSYWRYHSELDETLSPARKGMMTAILGECIRDTEAVGLG